MTWMHVFVRCVGWTWRYVTWAVWRATPHGFQLMLKLDASLAVSEIEDADVRAVLAPFAADLSGFPSFLDYTDDGQLPLSWAIGAFNVECGRHAFMRFYGFLDAVPAHALIPLLRGAGAQSDLILECDPLSPRAGPARLRDHQLPSRLSQPYRLVNA